MPSSQRLVLLCLCEHEKNRRCWPGITRMSIMTGLSRSTVQRALRGLERGGHMAIEEGASGRRIYYLRVGTYDLEVGHHDAPLGHHDTGIGHHDPTPRSQCYPNPLRESLTESLIELADLPSAKESGEEKVKVSDIHKLHDQETSDVGLLSRVKMVKQEDGSDVPSKSSVRRLYASLCSKYHPTIGVVVGTQKEVGQMNLLVDKLGLLSVEAVYYGVSEWAGMCGYVEKKAGLHISPALPSVGFMLQHCWLVSGYAGARAAEKHETAPEPSKEVVVTLTNSPETPQDAEEAALEAAAMKDLLSQSW